MEELQISEIETTFTGLVKQGYGEVACIMKKIITVYKIFSTI
jgi:hypothetical protein